MIRNENEGWWTSRTGLEKKLIILSTILFIVSLSLTIAVILKKSSAECHCESTCSVLGYTQTDGQTSSSVSVTGSDSTTASSPETSPTIPVSETTSATPVPETTPETTPTTLVPETTTTTPTTTK